MLWQRLVGARDVGLLIIRIGFGLGFFWFHGLPKLTGGPERWAGTGEAMRHVGIDVAPEMWGLAAGLAEGVGGLLIALGLFFRPAALAILVVMVMATTGHVVTGRGSPAHSLKNASLFLGLILTGPGRYSLDAVLAGYYGRRRKRRRRGR